MLVVSGRCSFSRRATELVLGAKQPRIVLAPTELDRPISWDACDQARNTLVEHGQWWLRLLPRDYVCARFADSARTWLEARDERLRTPTMVLDGRIAHVGLVPEAFAVVGERALSAAIEASSDPGTP